MLEQIIILLAVIVGYFLRDLQIQSIQKKAQQIKKKILPNKSKVLEWERKKSAEEIAEEEVMKGMGL